MAAVKKIIIFLCFPFWFLSHRIVSGLFGALFVFYHRKYVLLRRKYRKYTKWLEVQ